jgi:hypothetical protein
MAYISHSKYTQSVLNVLNSARKAGIPVLLWGAPGTGKTALIYALGEKENLQVKLLLGSTMDPTDLSGLPALKKTFNPETDKKYYVTENTIPNWADDLIKEGSGILFADELNNSTPSMQSGLLSLLQGRQVGQHKLPENVWILAASNEPEDAADGYDLAPPLANRLLHIKWNPPVEDWFDGMIANWGETNPTSELINERAKIVSFLKNYPNLVQNQPLNDADAGKAWASRRSWDNCAKVLSESPTDPTTRNIIISGLVGEEAAIQFIKWEQSLSLPTHEEILSNPDAYDWKTMSVDVVLTILNRTVAFVSPENIDQSVKVFLAAKAGKKGDIAASLMVSFLNQVKTVGAPVASLSPLLKDLGNLVIEAGVN